MEEEERTEAQDHAESEPAVDRHVEEGKYFVKGIHESYRGGRANGGPAGSAGARGSVDTKGSLLCTGDEYPSRIRWPTTDPWNRNLGLCRETVWVGNEVWNERIEIHPKRLVRIRRVNNQQWLLETINQSEKQQ